MPILLTGRIGAGRVAVLNAAGIYRWGLTAGGLSAGGVEGAFFGGLCRWLESAGNDRPVRIEAPDVSAEGAGVPIRLVTSEGTPGATAKVSIVSETGGAAVAARLEPSGEGTFTGSLPLAPGVHAMVDTQGWPVVVDEATLVEANDLGRRHTGIAVDHTGTAGLAGLLHELRRDPSAWSDDRIVVLFTGEERG